MTKMHGETIAKGEKRDKNSKATEGKDKRNND